MLSWILIALVIAVIFGVIKIDEVKAWAIKMQPQAEELLVKAKTWLAAKSAEAKSATNKKEVAEPKEENSDKPSAE